MPHPIELILKQAMQRLPMTCPHCHKQLNATLHILNNGSLVVHTDCTCGEMYATNRLQQIMSEIGCNEYTEISQQQPMERMREEYSGADVVLPEQLAYYKEENKKLQDTISTFERECRDACGDLFECACQRAIARMNKELAPELAGNDDAVSAGFSFFEVLSVSICHFGYSAGEINPHLPNYISDILEDECDNFSSSDLLVIEYGECIYRGSYGMYDFHTELLNRMTDTFYRLLDDTYNSDKVQQFCDHI